MNIDEKLKELRRRWVSEPHNRWNIEQQAKILTNAKKYPRYIPSEDERLKKMVESELLD